MGALGGYATEDDIDSLGRILVPAIFVLIVFLPLALPVLWVRMLRFRRVLQGSAKLVALLSGVVFVRVPWALFPEQLLEVGVFEL